MISEPRSRWTGVAPIRTSDGRVVLPEREPLAFRDRADNRTHVVLPEDALAALAGTYFAPLPRACGYWWAIAQFQPAPIVDPTLPLAVGRVLVIPSVATLAAYLGDAT